MSLRKKTFIILAVSFFILIAIISISSHTIFTNKFESLEKKQAKQNIVQAKMVLTNQLESFSNYIADCAAWDDTYQFIADRNLNYVKSNFVPDTFRKQNISAIVIADNSDQIIWSGQYDKNSGKIKKITPDLIKSILSFKRMRGKDKSTKTKLIWAAGDPYFVNFNRITRSDHTGNSQGVIISAYLVDGDLLNKLKKNTTVNFNLVKIPSIKNLDPAKQNLIKNLTADSSSGYAVVSIEPDSICGYSFLPDVTGEGGLLISTQNQKDILLNGRKALEINSFYLLIIGLSAIAAIMIIFEKLFLSRISLLTQQVQQLGLDSDNNKKLITSIDRSQNDEIAKLAGSIADTTSALYESRVFLDTLINSIESGVMLIDPESLKIILLNRTAKKLSGSEIEDNISLICDSDLDLSNGSMQICSFKGANDKSIVTLKGVSKVTREGKELILVTLTDISELLEAQKSLKLSELTYKTIFRNTGTASMLIDNDMRIILVNREFTHIAGFDRSTIENKMKWSDFFFSEDLEMMQEYHRLRRKGNDLAPRSYEARFIDREQRIRYVQMTVGMMPDGASSIASLLDITEQKEISRKLNYQAFHDSLTKLPNRFLLMDRMEHSLTTARRENKIVGVFMIDLDRFKIINDSMGHTHGDSILKQVSQRLSDTLRERDTLARFGGDEFIVIVEDANDESVFATIATKLLNALTTPFMIEDKELYVQASIGIAVYPSDGNTPEILIKNADLAMYRSKESGRNRYSLFTKEMDTITRNKVKIEQDLRAAVASDSIDVVFQPIIDMRTGKIVKLEALARWMDENGQMRSPAEFISVAEDCGLIVQLDCSVAAKAFSAVNRLNMTAKEPITLSINLSARHFESLTLPESILALLDDYNFPHNYLTVEITETCLMQNIKTAVPILDRIKNAGIKISLDDFGTGYSSLQYLQKLPINSLKIDKSFVTGIKEKDDSSSKLVQTIISLADNLSLQVVAEGVETKKQVDFLLKNKCDFSQGYYFSKPAPENEIKDLLETNFLNDYK